MPLSKEKKKEFFAKLTRMLSTYTKVFIVKVDNVGSQQMNLTRKSMRGSAGEILTTETVQQLFTF
jgi:large subunit ribosomal protein LP0